MAGAVKIDAPAIRADQAPDEAQGRDFSEEASCGSGFERGVFEFAVGGRFAAQTQAGRRDELDRLELYFAFGTLHGWHGLHWDKILPRRFRLDAMNRRWHEGFELKLKPLSWRRSAPNQRIAII